MAIDSLQSTSDALLAAEANRTARGRITEEWAGLDLEGAYKVQQLTVATKVAAGDQIIGTKLGLTSAAKQARMGITSPLTAVLLKSYILNGDVPVPLDKLIQPRVEPEIVFVMGKKLQGPGVTAATALDAVESVYAGFEVIDSRFVDYSFALPDVVAAGTHGDYLTPDRRTAQELHFEWRCAGASRQAHPASRRAGNRLRHGQETSGTGRHGCHRTGCC